MTGAAEVSLLVVRSRIVLLEVLLFALVSFGWLGGFHIIGWWCSRVDRMIACGSLVFFSGCLEWLC